MLIWTDRYKTIYYLSLFNKMWVFTHFATDFSVGLTMGYCLRSTGSLIINNIHALSCFSKNPKNKEFWNTSGTRVWYKGPVLFLRILMYHVYQTRGTIHWEGLTEGMVCNKAQPLRVRWKGEQQATGDRHSLSEEITLSQKAGVCSAIVSLPTLMVTHSNLHLTWVVFPQCGKC